MMAGSGGSQTRRDAVFRIQTELEEQSSAANCRHPARRQASRLEATSCKLVRQSGFEWKAGRGFPRKQRMAAQRAQNPLFRMLGTAEADKRHVVFDTPHDVSQERAGLSREVLAWLDKYLGRVN